MPTVVTFAIVDKGTITITALSSAVLGPYGRASNSQILKLQAMVRNPPVNGIFCRSGLQLSGVSTSQFSYFQIQNGPGQAFMSWMLNNGYSTDAIVDYIVLALGS
jgi:hypothetical protein